jgi:hypothetical protein
LQGAGRRMSDEAEMSLKKRGVVPAKAGTHSHQRLG